MDTTTIAVIAAALGVVSTVVFIGLAVAGVRSLAGVRNSLRQVRDALNTPPRTRDEQD
jgi:hypothetical protein